MQTRVVLNALLLVALVGPSRGDDAAKAFSTVRDLLIAHDHALMSDLGDYVRKNPKAEDLDQAYLALFEKAIEHDWFIDHEASAKRYLAEHPTGGVKSLAQIVTTMARAQAGQFGEALASYQDLIAGLDKDDQEEFAANFADTLSSAASTAGEYGVARKVLDALLKKFGESPKLREKVVGDLKRLDMIGRAAPPMAVTDVSGRAFRLADVKGKYVLIDFWATWCAPCVAELPNVQAAYAKYHKRGLEIVAVSLDETKEPLADFVKSRKIPWHQIHNPTCGSDVVEAFGVTSIPATFLVGPDGTIVRIELRGAALEKTLDKMLR